MTGGLEIRELRFLDWGPLSLSIAAGECVGVTGESGSGKSLLLRAIADLDPHGGTVALDGSDCSAFAAPEWRRRVAMLPAESRWWFDRVADHFPAEGTSTLAADLVELGFDGTDVLAWEVARLSAGERQRLALARLLCRDPQALLLDEPTANLDAGATDRVERLLGRRALTALWVSHDPGQLRRVARRSFRMEGRALREEPGWA